VVWFSQMAWGKRLYVRFIVEREEDDGVSMEGYVGWEGFVVEEYLWVVSLECFSYCYYCCCF